MQTNIGPFDRRVRIALGFILLASALVWPRTPWGWLGLVPLLTALVRVCPLYALIGLDTRPLHARRR